MSRRRLAPGRRAPSNRRMEVNSAFTAAIIDAALDCIVAADADGVIIEFNPAAERTFGLSRADAIGRSLADTIVPPHHRAAHDAGMARMAAGHAPRVVGRRIEIEGRRADGSLFPLELAIVRAERDGKPVFVAYMRDIAAQQDAARRLAESEERQRLAIEGAQLGTWSWDLRANTSWWSPRAREIFGFPAEGEPSAEQRAGLVHPEDRARVQEVVRRVMEEAGDAALEYRIVRPDGEVRWVLTRGIGHRDHQGRPTTATGIVSDISVRKAAEAELERSRDSLRQSEKLAALGSLLAGVSHELNNPLSAVIGQSVMLEEDAEGSPFAERARKIRAAAERCSRIVQTFLALARQKRPERGRVDINQVIRDSVELLDYGLRTSTVKVDLDLAADLPILLGDGDQLHQVVANLVVNSQQALAAQPGERRLFITTRAEAPGELLIRVADNGPGIAPAVARRIFEPFFTTKPQGFGTGLGLAYSLGVVEAHGGQLRLAPSEGGAVFEIRLPTLPAPEAEPAAMESPSPPAGRALVVDDEPDVRETLAEMLTRQGWDVMTASDGAAAKILLAKGEFDLILSDIRMPKLDGPGLFDWLAGIRPDLCDRVGFVTGDTLGESAVAFLATHGRPYIEKPFDRAGLDRLIAAIDPGVRAN